VRGPVTASLVRSAIDVSVFVRTAWTCASAVLCTRFLASFLHFRCLNVTTLFNTDVKIRFRAVATVSCSAAILCRCCGDLSSFTTCLLQVFQSTFSPVTLQLRRAATELCNFDAKQSSLCCFDGYRTRYCWHKCRCLFS